MLTLANGNLTSQGAKDQTEVRHMRVNRERENINISSPQIICVSCLVSWNYLLEVSANMLFSDDSDIKQH